MRVDGAYNYSTFKTHRLPLAFPDGLFYSISTIICSRTSMRCRSPASLIVALTSVTTGLAASIQGSNVILPGDAALHRQNVKDIFARSWNAYR